MLRPTPGELLAGVRRELTEQVLPYVPGGAPTRQLRAALHLLGRLERSWDLLPSYLQADNADLRDTLGELASRLGTQWTEKPGALDESPGVHDVALRALMAQNAQLQAELDRMQQEWRARRGSLDTVPEGDIATALHALHERMAERALRAAAVVDGS